MSLLNKKIKLTGIEEPVGTGWLPPVPDLRDYTENHVEIKAFNAKLKIDGKKLKQDSSVDLREWCSPVENQLSLGSFVYSLADDYRSLKYFCHDPIGNITRTEVPDSVKKYLTAGIPSMFGFWGFPTFENTNIPGGIPYPIAVNLRS